MTGTAYRVYCRSITRVQCSPVFLALAVAVIGVAYLAVQARMHVQGLDQVVRGTGALVLLAIGLGVLALTVRAANRNRAVVTVPEPGRQELPLVRVVTGKTLPAETLRYLHSIVPDEAEPEGALTGAGRP